MKNVLKIAAALVGVLAVLVVVAVVAVPMFFDPNDYRDVIVTKAKEATGRDVKIEGEIGLTVFPWIGADVGVVELGNAPGFSDPYFARVERVTVRVKLLPLLSRQVELDKVTVHGLALNLARDESGKTNWDDLAKGGGDQPGAEPGARPGADKARGGAELAGLAIGGLDVRNAQLRWTDAQAGQQMSVDRLDVSLGALAPSEPVELSLEADLSGDQLPVDTASVRLDGRVTADLAGNAVTVDDLALEIDLAGEQVPNGTAKVSLTGRASADPSSHALTIEDLVLKALELEVKGRLATTRDSVTGSLEVAEFNPRKLLEALGQSAPQTADPDALTRVSLSTTLSGSPAAVSLDPMALALDDTNLTGKLGVGGFDRTLPAVTFALDVDRMDADRYLPPAKVDEAKAGEATPVATPGAAAAEGAGLPLDTLRALDVDGTLKVGELKVAKLTTTDIVVTMKAKDGLVRLSPLGAKLYDGSYAGNVTLDARKDQPSIALDESLSGVQAGPLLADLTGKPALDGTAQVSAKLTAVGADVEAMKRTLNGNASVAFTNGAVNGINVARTIREFKAKLKGRSLPPAKEALKTDFSEITGTFTARNGVVTNDDLAAKSPLLRVEGRGKVDLPGDQVDYRPTVTLVATTKGQGGDELADLVGVPIPLKVTGPLAGPSYGVDFEQAVQIVAKSKAKDLVEEQLRGTGAAGALGGLLGAEQAPAGDSAEGGKAKAPSERPKGVEDAVKGLKGLLGN